MYDAKFPMSPTLVAWYLVCHDYDICTCATVKNTVKMHCNLQLVDKIEEIRHNDANTEWSSDKDSN